MGFSSVEYTFFVCVRCCSASLEHIERRVEWVMDILSLSHRADTLVGDEGV